MNLDGSCPAEKQPPPPSPGGRVGDDGVGGRGGGARGGGVALHGGSVRLVVVGVGQLVRAEPGRACPWQLAGCVLPRESGERGSIPTQARPGETWPPH